MEISGRYMVLMVAGILAALVVAVSVAVQLEAPPLRESLGGGGPERALILFHPSRDARLSDDLSTALAEGLKTGGLAVERATVTGEVPARPRGYALVAIVANTYWWTPDLPTLRFLKRARLDGIPTIGVIGGAGATGRSERMLRELMGSAGATVLAVRSFWLLRPNDENRLDEANREVALEMAEALGRETGEAIGAASDTTAEGRR